MQLSVLSLLLWIGQAIAQSTAASPELSSSSPTAQSTTTGFTTSVYSSLLSQSSGGACPISDNLKYFPFGFGPDGLVPLGATVTGPTPSYDIESAASTVPPSALGISSAELAAESDPIATPKVASAIGTAPAHFPFAFHGPVLPAISSILASQLATQSSAAPSLSSSSSPTTVSSAAPSLSSSSSPTPVSSAASTTTPPTPPSPSPTAPDADSCKVSYKFFYDKFDIHGTDFDVTKFGTDGSGLHDQLSGCGDLTHWSFNWTPGDPDKWQWSATGRLPIGVKDCVGRAVVSAGGADDDGCHGAG